MRRGTCEEVKLARRRWRAAISPSHSAAEYIELDWTGVSRTPDVFFVWLYFGFNTRNPGPDLLLAGPLFRKNDASSPHKIVCFIP